MRVRLAILLGFIFVLLILLVWFLRTRGEQQSTTATPASVTPASPATVMRSTASDSAPTNVSAHNLMLRKGPSFRVYVRWLQGQMARAARNVNPSFDDPDSFFLDIKTGVLRANIGDIGNFLNSGGLGTSPLKNITLSGDGDQMKLHGTLHKVISFPIELTGTLSIAPGNRIQIHVTKIDVLKIPFKGLLGGFHVTLAELFHPQGVPGLEVSGNDILLDTQTLLPPPHIRGQLTKLHIVNPDLEEIYGDAQGEVTRVEQWRNFLKLSGGTIDFGKLTMHQVDLIMVDISNDYWFDLDLANYQAQLVNGYTRMTPQAGLQIFMPDLSKIPHTKTTQNIGIEWLKNRNLAPPSDVMKK
ncbi:MAG: hypothetical protein M3Y72_24035 [Acidobacteriota bacterium]|nr:hypothetical protein [Acidobacteriota bacterium]